MTMKLPSATFSKMLHISKAIIFWNDRKHFWKVMKGRHSLEFSRSESWWEIYIVGKKLRLTALGLDRKSPYLLYRRNRKRCENCRLKIYDTTKARLIRFMKGIMWLYEYRRLSMRRIKLGDNYSWQKYPSQFSFRFKNYVSKQLTWSNPTVKLIWCFMVVFVY